MEERAKKLKIIAKRIDIEGLPKVQTSLILDPREKCHYQELGSRLITSRRVTKYRGSSTGASFRVAKGLSIRTGSSRGTPIRQDVTDRYSGAIAITNKKVIFIGDKGFEFAYDQITAIDHYSDATAFQVKNNRYVISTKDLGYMQLILDKAMQFNM